MPLRLLNSVRSFSIGQGAPTPLPTLLLDHLITTLRLDRLVFHHTKVDTAIVPKCSDKGGRPDGFASSGLGAGRRDDCHRRLGGHLPTFPAAKRSFAPAQISCRQQARLLDCRIAPYGYQRGLLDIVRSFIDS